MKPLLVSFLILGASFDSALAIDDDSLINLLAPMFGGKAIEVQAYDKQLKLLTTEDGNIVFVSNDGRYLFNGTVYDTQRKVDIVEEQNARQRRATINAQPDDLFVRYQSSNATKYKITVFTDIDCPFCRQLHNSIDTLNERGVAVNYVMIPRSGRGSASYAKTQKALCSDSPSATITEAMRNIQPANIQTAGATCDSSQLQRHMALASKLKINSTPTIVLPNGNLKVGLISPDKLVSLLQEIN